VVVRTVVTGPDSSQHPEVRFRRITPLICILPFISKSIICEDKIPTFKVWHSKS